MHSAHFKNRGSLIRSELSARYQCSRERKGHGPIKIRIICNVSSEPRSSNLLQCLPSLPRNAGVSTRMLRKNRPASAGSSDNSQKKQMRAELILEKLGVQAKLDGATRKLKPSQALVNYYKMELLQKDRTNSKYFNVEVGSKADPVENFCEIIEKAASLALPANIEQQKPK
jgi:hypothetical protein